MGHSWPPALLQMLVDMRLLSNATLEMRAERVHTPSFSPLCVDVCVIVYVCTSGCCTFQLSHTLLMDFLV